MNTTQSGRSMLEMLAVLCVIGVLTVGVLLGYRQGMIRYKTYRTHVELSEAVDGIYRVCGFFGQLSQCSPAGAGGVGGALVNAGVVANNMNNPFGHSYSFNVGNAHAAGAQTIVTDVDTDDICAELAAEDWPAGVVADNAHGQVPHCIAGGTCVSGNTACRLELHLEN